jgi:hypothetical protein
VNCAGHAAGVLIAAALAQAAVVSHNWRAGHLTLTLDDGTAAIEWISPVTFRVSRSVAGVTYTPRPIRHDAVVIAFEEADDLLRMRSRYITVEVDRSGLDLRVLTNGERVSTLSAALTAAGAAVRFGPVDQLFGLQSDSTRLNIRGQALARSNGFWFTNSGYGIAWRFPEAWHFDLDANVARAEAARSIELVFYYGPTPKEILENHQTVVSPGEVTRRSLAVLPPNQLPSPATRLPETPIDSWDALARLVRRLNHWSLSAVLYPAFDLSTLASAPPDVRQRALDLAAVLPLVYNSGAGPDPDRAVREAFTPHFTTYLREAFDRGFPLIHPLPFQFPKDANADADPGVFMLGDEFLVAPVVSPGSRRRLTLPRGLWTDVRTNVEYRGNQEIEIEAPAGRVPMLARNGSLFPISAGERMELHYIPSLGGEFFLWEPEQLDNSQFHASPAGEYLRVEIETKVRRTYEWVLHHTRVPRDVAEEDRRYQRVTRRGDLGAGKWWHDREHNNLHLVIVAEPGTDRIVNVAFPGE